MEAEILVGEVDLVCSPEVYEVGVDRGRIGDFRRKDGGMVEELKSVVLERFER